MTALDILARDGAARAGVLRTAHGEVHTPAFVPLASHATVRALESREVAGLGFEMVLGNTFHLFIRPGHEHVAAMGGLHEFMGWDGPVITDSGGFQVFSMGHGSVADEVKRSGGHSGSDGKVLSIEEEGVTFRSYVDGEDRFMGPETSMEVQAALGSDIVLAFDECTPFHADRDYTRRSTERTHRWLERCLEWRAANAPAGSLFYGIVQGATWEDLRRGSARHVGESGADGVAIGGSLGRDKAQIREVTGWAVAELPEAKPRHLLGIGDVDDIVAAVAQGIDTFDCATPTRLGRHGTALVSDPGARWRLDLKRPSERESRDPIEAGCPCPACSGHTRGYLHYLARSGELTAVRLLTLHNLTFMAALMEVLRGAIEENSLEEVSARLLAGGSPYLELLRIRSSRP